MVSFKTPHLHGHPHGNLFGHLFGAYSNAFFDPLSLLIGNS